MITTARNLLDTIENLSRFHREHEKFYAQAPLEQAIALQRWTRSLKALADHWQQAEPVEAPLPNRYAGCEDLNVPAAIDGNGILFLEGEGEPAELSGLKQELAASADRFAATGRWLTEAMESSWATAQALLQHPQLADLLGERHRIIANDWQAAGLNSLDCPAAPARRRSARTGRLHPGCAARRPRRPSHSHRLSVLDMRADRPRRRPDRRLGQARPRQRTPLAHLPRPRHRAHRAGEPGVTTLDTDSQRGKLPRRCSRRISSLTRVREGVAC